MDIHKAQFELTAFKPEQYLAGDAPEIALVGRSNVGKSTIINTLLNRRNLARVSAEPGKTRGINFYTIEGGPTIVDLPGYGYAKVSKDQQASWGRIIETYLNGRKQLRAVMMLVDIRHKPSADDRVMYEWIRERGIKALIVATKTDKIPRGQVQSHLKEIREVLDITAGTLLIPYSSETRQGKEAIWEEIVRMLAEGEESGQ